MYIGIHVSLSLYIYIYIHIYIAGRQGGQTGRSPARGAARLATDVGSSGVWCLQNVVFENNSSVAPY